MVIDLGELKKWAFYKLVARTQSLTGLKVEVSADASSWAVVIDKTDVATSASVKTFDFDTIVTTAYRYVRITATNTGGVFNIEYFLTGKHQVEFNSPPAAGDPLTYSCTFSYIPKDSLHLLRIAIGQVFGDENP